jgi:HAD superfamily hydrolase (TIGR01549 family)
MTEPLNAMPPRGLLFDMDGTLTEPLLDFPRIKAEMGIGNRPILEALAEMDEPKRTAAEQILLRHEEQAARSATLNHGCTQLLQWLAQRQIPMAIVTRNSRRSASVVISQHRLQVDALVTRDDGIFKPDPASLHLACRRIGLRGEDVWMIGDGEYDIEAGHKAGIRTVWLSHGRQRHFAHEPWRDVADLCELHTLLREQFES